MKNEKYIPVNCDFVDVIEHYATLRETIHLHYLDDQVPTCIMAQIETWINKGGTEYLRLKNHNQLIRLDHILSINDVSPDTNMCIITPRK